MLELETAIGNLTKIRLALDCAERVADEGDANAVIYALDLARLALEDCESQMTADLHRMRKARATANEAQ